MRYNTDTLVQDVLASVKLELSPILIPNERKIQMVLCKDWNLCMPLLETSVKELFFLILLINVSILYQVKIVG